MNSNTIQIAIEVDDKGSVKLRQIGKEAAAAGDAGAKGFDKMSRSAKGASDQSSLVASTVRSMGAAIAAAVSVEAVRRLIELADSYTRIDGRLKLVTTSTANLAAVQAQLYAASQRSTASYIATAEAYARIAQNTKDLHLAQSTLVTITETLNKAFTVSGATEVERSATMIQLSQAFSAGALRGEEFNSVAEQGGRVLDLLADYLHASRGELKAMAEDGKLTSDVLINSITYGAEKVNAEFDAMPKTVSQAGTVLGNVLGSLVNDANKSSGATAGLSQSVFDLARTIEENKAAILSVFTGIVESAGWAVQRVANLANAVKGMAAVASGALSVIDFAQMNPEEMTQWMTDFDHGMAGVRKEITETAAKLKELGEEDPALVDEAEFTKTQQHFDALRGQIAAYENQLVGASINSQAQVKGTIELQRQREQQEKDVAAAIAAGTGVQKLSNDALDKLYGRLTPVHQAQVQYKKDLEEIEKAHKSGQLVGEVYNEALKTAKDHLDKATGATASHKKALSESEKEAKKAAQASKAAAKEYQSILDSLEPARVEQERYNEALAVLNQMDPTHQTERYKNALEELNKTTKEGHELEQHRADIMGDLEDYERQVAQASMTDAEIRIDNINRQTDALIKYGNELVKLHPEYQALAEEGAAAFGERARKQIEAITDDAGQMGKMFDDVAKSIQGAFSDMFLDMMDDTDNALDSIADMFKKLIAEMATVAIANPIIIPITASIGSAMGLSDSSIAKTLGVDTSQITGGASGIGGLFSSGSTIAGGVSSLLSGWGSDLAFSDSFSGLSTTLFDISDLLSENLTVGSGILAGVGSLALSLFSGDGLTAQSASQAGGAALGTVLTAGNPIGGILGGIVGSLVGDMFGTGVDTFGPQYMANDVGVNYSATDGMTPTTIQYTGGDTDSQIAKVYAEQMRSIQTAFDDQVTALAEALPDEISSAMLASLSSANLKQILNNVSGQEINVADAASWMEGVAEAYSEGLLAELGKAYGSALSSFISANGAEGLVGDSAAWGMLTEAVKQNITDSFQSAAATIAGGDIDTGLETINSVTNAIAAIESAMAPISEIIATNGLSDYELSLRSVNQQFDAYSAALQAAGVDMTKYTDLEKARGIAIAQVQETENKRLADLAEEAAQKAAALADQRQSLEIQIMEAIGDSAGALSATRAIELAAMDESLRPLQERIYSLQDEETAAEAANAAAKKLVNESITGLQTKIDDMISQYGDLTAAMAELDPVAATLVDSWRANKTELENLISGLASAMGELPKQTALERLQSTLSALSSATNGIANLNDQIFALQTGTASSAAIGLLKAREQELFASMATSLDPGGVASELASIISKRITMQASIEEDAINARYQAEYDAANTVAELEKQLRTDQISALQDQISAAKTLVDVVSSMPQFLAELRYGDLSSLNPVAQFEAAQGNFYSILAAANNQDTEAMQQLQGVGTSYLQEAQSRYGGATSPYAAVFAEVTGAMEEFGAQPVTDIDLLQSQVEYLQGIETATNTLNSTTIDTTDQQIDALIDVRDALTKREEQLAAQKAEDRQAVQAQIDQLKAVVTGQEAQIRQQAAMHAELMAQLAQANASLEALENTASMEAAAPS